MQIKVKLFGVLRSMVPRSEFDVALPKDSDVKVLMRAIEDLEPSVDFQVLSVNIAKNRAIVSADSLLRDGDEVSFIPPIAGG